MAYIIPIKDLKETSKISELCHSVHEPVHITKNGYGDMVIMSTEVFDALSKRWQIYADIQLSRQQADNGMLHDASETLNSLRCKYGI